MRFDLVTLFRTALILLCLFLVWKIGAIYFANGIFPRSWPDRRVGLPPKSQPALLHLAISGTQGKSVVEKLSVKTGSGNTGFSWYIGFTNSMSIEENFSFYDSSLKRHGFKLRSADKETRRYVDKSGELLVAVIASMNQGDYCLKVIKYDHPSEFALERAVDIP